jgi:hypothetical protein
MLQIPEGLFPVRGLAPIVGAAAPLTADYISLKNAEMCWVVFHYYQADANEITFYVYRSLLVASGGVALVNEVPIWSNLDCATSNTLIRRADGLLYAAGAAAGHKLVIFQIDPASLGGAYDCIVAGTVGNVAAAQYLSILYLVKPKQAMRVADQFSFITD